MVEPDIRALNRADMSTSSSDQSFFRLYATQSARMLTHIFACCRGQVDFYVTIRTAIVSMLIKCSRLSGW